MRKAIKTSIITTIVAGNLAIVSLSPSGSFAGEKLNLKSSHPTSHVVERLKDETFSSARKDVRRKVVQMSAFKELSDYLSITPKELISKWREQGTLSNTISSLGYDVEAVRAYLVAKSDAQLSEALNEGKLTQEQVNKIKANRSEKLSRLLYETDAPEIGAKS